MKFRVIPAMLLAFGLACSEVCAEFVPGRLYASGGVGFCVKGEKLQDDGIYEFDPLTGDWRIFATLPEGLCGHLGGMTFTPDYSRLRVSSYTRNSILEIDGDGNATVALGPQDGIANPLGGNNLAYAPNGDFYVSDFTRILRFPADGGPAELFADFFDGIRTYGPLAIAPDGNVYFGTAGLPGSPILKFTPDGQGTVFDTVASGHFISSLAIDDAGNVFAATTGGTFRYLNQDAATRTQLNNSYGDYRIGAVSLSDDGATLYQVSVNRFRATDTVTGQTIPLGFLAADFDVGYGMALYVPEPTALFALVISVVFGRRFLRFDSHR